MVKRIFLKNYLIKLSIVAALIFSIHLQSYGQEDQLSIYLSKFQQYTAEGQYSNAFRELLNAEEYIGNEISSPEIASQTLIQLYIQVPTLSDLKKENSLDDYEFGRAYEYNANKKLFSGDFRNAEPEYLKAIEILAPQGKAFHAYRWLGLLYGITQRSNEALDYYYLALNDIELNYDPENRKTKKLLLLLYTNFQVPLLQFGNYKEVGQNIRSVIKYATELDDQYYLSMAYLNEASLYVAKEQPDNVINALEKMKPFLEEQETLSISYNNMMAIAYELKEDKDNALLYFKRSIDAIPENSPNKLSRLVNEGAVAEIYYDKKEYDKSLRLFNDVIQEYEQNATGFESSLAEVYMHRAKVHLAQNNIEKAYEDVKSSLSYEGDFKTWKVRHYSSLTNIYAAYFVSTKDKLYADSIMWNIKRTDAFIDSMRTNNRHLESEIGLNSFLFDAYTNNLDALFELYKSDKGAVDFEYVFSYFEKIKSYVQKEYLKTDDAVNEGMLPDEKLKEERRLKRNLVAAKKKLFMAQKTASVSKEVIEINRVIEETESAYSNFLNQIEKDYPNYFSFQTKQYETDLNSVQRELEAYEAIVEYFVNSTHIYILTITSEKCNFYKIDKAENWKKDFNAFLDLLSTPPAGTAEDNIQNYVTSANRIYNVLLKDPLTDLGDTINHLIIVGDNELNFLPFEILVDTPNNNWETFAPLPYLMEDYAIAYDVSVASYMESQESNSKSFSTNYVGFSPEYEDDAKDLPYTRSNIEKISSMYNGTSLVDQKIEIEDVMRYSQNSKILHFGMHGEIDQLNPSLSHLVFSENVEDQFYVSDIYGSNFDADLVVLSACNTGTGQYLKGEGVQNISRAFRFAGIPSTTMSLWSLPDVQTSKIEYAFFENLKSGLRKDEALQMAKISYLDNAPAAYQHPFYWGGIIPIGNMDAISFKQSIPSWYIFAALFLLFAIVLLFFYEKKK